MPKQKITVEFSQTGAPALVKQIHKVANATNKLTNTQQGAVSAGNKFEQTGQRVTSGMRNANKGTKGLLGNFAVLRNKLLLATFAYQMVLKPIVRGIGVSMQASMEFEKLQTRLVSLFGSVKEGETAFREFNKIAATTPYTVQDVVNAGAQLEAFGANSRELLKNITDLASYMGTNATEAANAFGRAFAGGAGAADILRERGILNLVKDFKKIDDITELTLPEFRKALIEAMEDPAIGIMGATDRMARTLMGKYSNMNDAIMRMQASIGDLLKPALEEGVIWVTEMANSFGKLADAMNDTPTEALIKEFERLEIAVPDELLKVRSLEEARKILDDMDDSLIDLASDINTAQIKADSFFGIFEFVDIGGKINEMSGKDDLNRLIGEWEIYFELMDKTVEGSFDKMLKHKSKFFGLWVRADGVAGEDAMAGLFGDFLKEEGALEKLTGAIDSHSKSLAHLLEERYKQREMSESYFDEAGVEANRLGGLIAIHRHLISTYTELLEVYGENKNALELLSESKKEVSEEDKKLIAFGQAWADELSRINKLYQKSDEVQRVSIVSLMAWMDINKDTIIAYDNAINSITDYNIVLDILQQKLDKLDKVKDPPIDAIALKKQLREAYNEMDNMDKLLEKLEKEGWSPDILDALEKHSKAYKQVVTDQEALESAFSSTDEGQKRQIQSLIDLIKTYDGVKLSTQDLLDLEANLIDKKDQVGQKTEKIAETYTTWLDKIKKAAAAEADEVDWLKTLQSEFSSLDKDVQDYIKTQGLLDANLSKADLSFKLFKASIVDQAQAVLDDKANLEKFRAELLLLSPELQKVIETMNLFGEAMQFPEYELKMKGDFKDFEHNKKLIDDLVDSVEGLDSAYADWVREVVAGMKKVEKADKIGEEFDRTLQGQIRTLNELVAAITNEQNRLLRDDEEVWTQKNKDATIVLEALRKKIEELEDQLSKQGVVIDNVVDTYIEWVDVVQKKVDKQKLESGWTQQLITDNVALAKDAGYVVDTYEALVEKIEDRVAAQQAEIRDIRTLKRLNKDLYEQGLTMKLFEEEMTPLQQKNKILRAELITELKGVTGAQLYYTIMTQSQIDANRGLNLSTSEQINLSKIYKDKVTDLYNEILKLTDLEGGKTNLGEMLGDADGLDDQLDILTNYLDTLNEMSKLKPADLEMVEGSDWMTNLEDFEQFVDDLDLEKERVIEIIDELNDKLEEQEGFQNFLDNASFALSQFQGFVSAIHAHIDRETEEEIKAMKKTNEWIYGNSTQREALEEKVRQKAADKKQAMWKYDQALAVTDIAISTAMAVMKTMGQTGIFGTPLAAMITAMGIAQTAMVLSQKPPEYEQGGIVGGKRHYSGGTLIEAEKGEYVLNRSAVSRIGVDNLDAMNEGEATPQITINISGNVLTSDFVENELAEKVQEAIRKGVDFGIS